MSTGWSRRRSAPALWAPTVPANPLSSRCWRALRDSIPGVLTTQKGVTLGYLPQDGLSLSGRTVFAECMTVFAKLRELEQEQEQLGSGWGKSTRRAPSMPRWPTASTEWRANFAPATPTPWNRRWARCSAVSASPHVTGGGGPRSSRAAGRCASRWPSCCSKSRTCCCWTSRLTTWISRRATGWKSTCRSYPYAFVLVSHDRYFLDVTVRKIIELWNKNLHVYTGGYTRYEELKTERRRNCWRHTRISRSASSSWKLSSIASATKPPRPSRYRAGSRNWTASNESKFRRMKRPFTSAFRSRSRAGALWRSSRRSPKRTVDTWYFRARTVLVERGDRVSLVGVNGAGKSTMIKILAGAETVTSGEYILGHNAQPDYFAQDQYKELDPDARHARRSRHGGAACH